MTREQIEALAEKYQTKADKAYQNYQETGASRYNRDYCNNQDLAEALWIAARAADDSQQLVSIRSSLSVLGNKAIELRDSKDGQKIQAFLETVITEAKIRGLVWDRSEAASC